MRYVFKFGGSSLASTEKIKQVATFIKTIKQRKNTELIIVVSAMGKLTDKLEALAKKITNQTSMAYSSLICLGENISTYLLTLALEELSVEAIGLTSKDIKIHSKGDPSSSIITHIDTNKINQYLKENKVVVVSGFQGENEAGQTLTLGRGGSDTTAVALGYVFNAKVKIFTDVKGFFALNPKLYNNSKLLRKINITSAINLSNTGAKVLDYRCLCLANKNKTNLEVCESLKSNGTKITYNNIENYHIDGISVKNKIIFVKNTSNKINLLQTIFENTISKTYFYQKNQFEWLALEYNKSILQSFKTLKTKQLFFKNADILTLSGSGLLSHKDFFKKVHYCIKNSKVPIYHINLTQTTLTIITKQNKANEIEKELGKIFNLFKE